MRKPIHVGFEVDKMALEQVSLRLQSPYVALHRWPSCTHIYGGWTMGPKATAVTRENLNPLRQ
jgi:hypothetical protein